MAIPLVYNVQHIRQRPVATLATAVGIGLVVAIFIGGLALAHGFQAALVATGSPDNVIVVRKGADSEMTSGLGTETISILRANPAVATAPNGRPLASPEVVVSVNKPRLGQTGSSNVQIRGVDVDGLALRENVRVTEGRMFRPGAPEVIVGRRIANRFANCGIGDRLKLRQQYVTVVGHFSAGGSGFESEIWGDNKVLMPLLRGEVYQSMTFRMRDPSKIAQLREQLKGDPRLNVDLWSEREFYARQSERFTQVLRIIGIIVSVIMAVGAVFAAMNTMYAAVGARTREVAVLRTLGFGSFSIATSFLAESVMVALIGGVLGCLLALPINGITTSTTNWASFSELAFAFRVTPGALLAGLVFAAVIGFIGGLLPARRAARRGIVASLRAV